MGFILSVVSTWLGTWVKKGPEALSQPSGTEGSKNWWCLSWLTFRDLFWFQVWPLLLGDEPRAICLWSSDYPLEHQVKPQQEAGHLQPKERAFTRHWPCWHLDLEFLGPRTGRQWICCLGHLVCVILLWQITRLYHGNWANRSGEQASIWIL